MDLSKSLLRVANSAYRMLQNDECGFTKEEEEIVFRSLQYWIEKKHHFDERSGRACIANIFYYKDGIHKEYAPFFDFDDVKMIYEPVKAVIPDYTLWDFAVTMNMMFSNHYTILKKLAGKKNCLLETTSKMAVEFLADEDTMHPTDKIWWYMNG